MEPAGYTAFTDSREWEAEPGSWSQVFPQRKTESRAITFFCAYPHSRGEELVWDGIKSKCSHSFGVWFRGAWSSVWEAGAACSQQVDSIFPQPSSCLVWRWSQKTHVDIVGTAGGFSLQKPAGTVEIHLKKEQKGHYQTSSRPRFCPAARLVSLCNLAHVSDAHSPFDNLKEKEHMVSMNFLELYFLHEIFLSVIEFHKYDSIW